MRRATVVVLAVVFMASTAVAAPTTQPVDLPPVLGKPGVKLNAAQQAELLSGMQKRLSSLKTLVVQFEQSRELTLFDEVVRTQGYLVFEQPDKVRYEIAAPFQSVLIVNGNRVAKYEKMREGWRKLRTPQKQVIVVVMEQIVGWLRGEFKGKHDLYAIHALGGSEPTIVLTPKHDRLAKMIKQIDIRIARTWDRFESITIQEPGGDYSKMSFGGEFRNRKITASVFSVAGDQPNPLPKWFSATQPANERHQRKTQVSNTQP